MRYIRTTNNYIELIETNNEGTVISTNGFRFGELYFKIISNKVTFYINDQENPWRNDVWTCGIPITIDGVEYATEDEASEILNKIMIPKPPKFKVEVISMKTLENYYTKDETDDLLDKEADKDLFDAEVLIRETTDIALSGAIDTKLDISAFTEYSGSVEDKLINIENNIYSISGDINTISGDVIDLSDALQREIERATSAETDLDQAIKDEESRAKVEEIALSERILEEIDNRISGDTILQNEINDLDDRLQQEIDRSTREDSKHDTLISGLTEDLADETSRAISAENTIINNLNQEINDRKAEAVASGEYDSVQKSIYLKNKNGVTLSTIDATDFVKDGMVDNVAISGGSLVITFNADADKEAISIPLSDIFNPNNYYNKTEIDTKVNTINNNITNVDNKFDNYYTKTETNNNFQPKGNYVSASTYNSYTSTTNTAITNLQNNKQDKLTAGRAIDITSNVVSFTLPISAGTGIDSLIEGSGTTAIGDYSHSEGYNCIAEGNYSHSEGNRTSAITESSHCEGNYTLAQNKYEHACGTNNISSSASTDFGDSGNTLFSVGNGNGSSNKHNAIDVRQNGDIYISNTNESGEYYQKPMVRLQDYLKDDDTKYYQGDGITISSTNVISTVTKFWCGTLAQYNAIATKDANTIYLIHD